MFEWYFYEKSQTEKAILANWRLVKRINIHSFQLKYSYLLKHQCKHSNFHCRPQELV